MLSREVVVLLIALTYRSDARWKVNILPFGSIFWEDEMPSLGDLLDKPEDLAIINNMFAIRIQLWDSVAPAPQDQQLWDSVKSQVPRWSLFQRIQLNDEQKQARKEAEYQVEQEFEGLSAGSDTESSE
jgi:hypothetical protein